MSDERKKPSWAFWTTIVVVVTLAYPLSIGPMFFLADRGVISRDFGGFYAPIGWIAERSRPIMAAHDWYLSLWVDIDLPDWHPPESEIPEAVAAP